MVTRRDYNKEQVEAARSVLLEVMLTLGEYGESIYYCIREYPGGSEALARHLEPMAGHGLVREALLKIAQHFASPAHRGPRHVADFEDVHDEEDRAQIQRDAHERVSHLLREIG